MYRNENLLAELKEAIDATGDFEVIAAFEKQASGEPLAVSAFYKGIAKEGWETLAAIEADENMELVMMTATSLLEIVEKQS
ncbi:MAG: hypothetical protein ACOX3W_00355 [Christensenellaceae bacterium]